MGPSVRLILHWSAVHHRCDTGDSVRATPPICSGRLCVAAGGRETGARIIRKELGPPGDLVIESANGLVVCPGYELSEGASGSWRRG